jgi:hypothetical protein
VGWLFFTGGIVPDFREGKAAKKEFSTASIV